MQRRSGNAIGSDPRRWAERHRARATPARITALGHGECNPDSAPLWLNGRLWCTGYGHLPGQPATLQHGTM